MDRILLAEDRFLRAGRLLDAAAPKADHVCGEELSQSATRESGWTWRVCNVGRRNVNTDPADLPIISLLQRPQSKGVKYGTSPEKRRSGTSHVA